jgi:hypothetical protein
MMNERAVAWHEASLRSRLCFSPTDDHGCSSLPFALCRRGDEAVSRHVSCGVIDGREVRTFDLDIVEHDDGSGGIGATSLVGLLATVMDEGAGSGGTVTERWECALVRAGAECARLAVMPEGIVTTLADLALVPDQELELEAFNRAFEVRADDRRFASDLLDPRMVAFLLEQAAGCVVETVGNRILVARPASEPPDLGALVRLAFGVAERVSPVVKTLHPPLPVGELTPRCPIAPSGAVRSIEPLAERSGAIDAWPDAPGGWA